MKTIEVKLYSFNELSEEAKQNAIKKEGNNEHRLNYDWYEFVYEDWMQKIQDVGFDISKIYFSGFWSQGDGAMFEYDGLDDKLKLEFINQLPLSDMRKGWLINNISISGKGKQRGHYYHEKSCSHSIYWEVDNGDLHWSRDLYKWLESFSDDFENWIEDKYIDLCCDLYKALEDEYDYLMSEDTIRTELSEDDFTEYTEDGNRY
jgi:hypothetical protein